MSDIKSITKPEVESILGYKIKSFDFSSFTNKGDNVAGELYVLTVTNTNDETHTYVYKCFPSSCSPEQLEYLIKFGAFRVETCTYEIVFPRVRELLAELSMDTLELPVPGYISGFNDDKQDYLVVEDLRGSYKMQSKYESLVLPEVSLVMEQIGLFHALTYYLIRYEGEKFFTETRTRALKYNARTVEDPMFSEMFPAMTVGYLENSAELLETRDIELSNKLKKFVTSHSRDIKKIMRYNTERIDTQDFACIIHGDLWTNNILFKYKHPNRDSVFGLKFIDFQQTRRATIYEELGYFFWTSVTPQFRTAHLTGCLQTYYDSFTKTLDTLNFPRPRAFSFGNLIDGFNSSMLSFYLYMPFALSLQMGDLKYMKPEESEEPEPFDFVKADKRSHYLRMSNSPEALDRLEILTREAALLKLI